MDLPPFVTAATGMDALTHNLEAYLAKDVSSDVRGHCTGGDRLIHQSIEQPSTRPISSQEAG